MRDNTHESDWGIVPQEQVHFSRYGALGIQPKLFKMIATTAAQAIGIVTGVLKANAAVCSRGPGCDSAANLSHLCNWCTIERHSQALSSGHLDIPD